jgi:hypothetical protein
VKTCTKCRQEKSIDEFRKGRAYKDGIRSMCKLCEAAQLQRWRSKNPDKVKAQEKRHNDRRKAQAKGYYDPSKKGLMTMQRRNAHLLRKYGISLDDYLKMREAQDGKCAICEELPKPTGNKLELVVDHCHRSGKVRALLCDRCNRALGVVNDDADLLLKLRVYVTDR